MTPEPAVALPVLWPLERLLEEAKHLPGPVVGFVTPSVRELVTDALPSVRWIDVWPPSDSAKIGTLLAIGGGTLLDEAKAWRRDHAPGSTLVVIPSIWGSGAEASPVVVLTRDGKKTVRIGPEYLPDVRIIWPELAEGLSAERAAEGCGDAWSHALEAFLSPLADDVLRREIALVMREMLAVGVGKDTRWFELSARACALQSSAGVGLIHGIAHTLEPSMRAECDPAWGHARLCACLLWPVTCFHRDVSTRWDDYAREYNLPVPEVLRTLRGLFDPARYEQIRIFLAPRWKDVLRDPCTRTNGVLVRPAHLAYFLETDFRREP